MLKRVKDFFRRVKKHKRKHTLRPRTPPTDDADNDNDNGNEKGPWMTLRHSGWVADINAASHGTGAAAADARQHAADLHDAEVQARRLRSINVVKQKTEEPRTTACAHSSSVALASLASVCSPPCSTPSPPPSRWEFADLAVERVIGMQARASLALCGGELAPSLQTPNGAGFTSCPPSADTRSLPRLLARAVSRASTI